MPPAAVQVTVTSGTATPPCVTLTTNGAKGVPIVPVWLLPETMVMTKGGGFADSVKVAEALKPGAEIEAVTATLGEVGVNVLLAWPKELEEGLVTEVVVPSMPVPEVTVQVTVTPETGVGTVLKLDVTSTTSGAGSWVPIVPVWLLPETMEMEHGETMLHWT